MFWTREIMSLGHVWSKPVLMLNHFENKLSTNNKTDVNIWNKINQLHQFCVGFHTHTGGSSTLLCGLH